MTNVCYFRLLLTPTHINTIEYNLGERLDLDAPGSVSFQLWYPGQRAYCHRLTDWLNCHKPPWRFGAKSAAISAVPVVSRHGWRAMLA